MSHEHLLGRMAPPGPPPPLRWCPGCGMLAPTTEEHRGAAVLCHDCQGRDEARVVYEPARQRRGSNVALWLALALAVAAWIVAADDMAEDEPEPPSVAGGES